MEKFVRKLVNTCDFCGKECESTDFKIPMLVDVPIDATDAFGAIITRIHNDEIVDCDNLDICPKCREKLAYMLKLMPYTTVDKSNGKIDFQIKSINI